MIGRVRPWILISIWIAVIPFVSTAYLEVHIAEEVLQTLDIGQNDIIVICLACYQTAGDTSYRSLIGTPAAIKGHTGCTDTCLGGGTVGLQSLRYGTDRIRELFLARKYRNKARSASAP